MSSHSAASDKSREDRMSRLIEAAAVLALLWALGLWEDA